MTDQRFVADLNSLESRRRSSGQLAELARRGQLKGQRRVAEYKAPASGGGGISSPLTETSAAARTHWPEQTLTSSDGLFTFAIKPVKKVTLRDADNAEVEMIYAQPPTA
ncbi:hypothetical protein [Atopomonas sediminilitoris]|uniref:hypothetical protein n=1 Tax=Atopomonas sediminilitoris TaxID=2919919 RepID=UPI001F4E5721|nr:hypothetical protein [Atopomonas sediminilitoris]MCJ8168627.1 hypothetical protein [Atopomonas sediminilitoris]